MAIIQISKIQVRSGNLVDLPQLDTAEFGWASDSNKLYIGRTTPNENIEVLTSYSNIYFSQLNGSYGNLNITTPVTGQTLTYNQASNTWVNTGGNALAPGNTSYYSNTPVHLGNVSNVYIGGGAIGYVLQTDGTGNLAWTPQGVITANISGATQADPVVVTTAQNNYFVDGQKVTITNVSGMTQLNGNTYYANVLTSNTFSLYTDSGLTVPVNGSAYGAYTGNGRAVASIGSGGGTAGAGGATYSVQYNSGGIVTGDANYQWNYTTQALSVTGSAAITGNANVGNLGTAGQIISTIGTGTAPLTVSSTTQVANLNVASSGTSVTVTNASQPNITSVGTLTSVTTTANGNVNVGGEVVINSYNQHGGANYAGMITMTNSNVSDTNRNKYVRLNNTGNLQIVNSAYTATIFDLDDGGNLTQLTSVSASGNITGANITGNHYGNGATLSSITGANVTGTVANATYSVSAGIAGTVTTNAQPNITSVGTLTSLSVAGNITGANLIGNHYGNGATLSSITGANVTGQVAYAAVANSVAGANVSGQVSNALIAGTVYTAAQPNITTLGTLNSVVVSGNATVGLLNTSGQVGGAGATFYGNTLTTGLNTTAGTITGNWTLSSGSRLQATYADLAEYYEADQNYEPGTVLAFGGDKEVTLAEDGTTRVAGIVSTNPAYAMNANCQGIAVAIALQGRVPAKVRGNISKGDMMVSAGNGYARPSINPSLGMVIGKALEDFTGVEGVIEIVVGRL
jgi:hypothetical protein